jgi:hypothetical protein
MQRGGFMKKIMITGIWMLAMSCLPALAQSNAVSHEVKSSTTRAAIQTHAFSPSTEATLSLPVNSRDVTTSPTAPRLDITGHRDVNIDPAVTAAMRSLEIRAAPAPPKGSSVLETVRQRIASGYYDEARDRAAFLPDVSFSGGQMNILKTFLQ